jgi:hypothetical protein
MLRALPQAESVGRLLCAAWNEATAQGRALRENAPAAPRAEARQPAATEPAGAGVTLAGGHAG